MNKILLSLLLCFSGHAVADTSVYRSLDEEGNPVFSDEPSPDAEALELREVQTVPAEGNLKFEYTPAEKETPTAYEDLSFSSPLDDTAVRENAGNLVVTLVSKPALRPGHRVVLYLDGEEVGRGMQTTFNLENLDRGTHTLSAEIAHGDKVLIESESVTFTLLRHSEQHPKPAPPPPPPPPP